MSLRASPTLVGLILVFFYGQVSGADLAVSTSQLSLKFSESGNLLSAQTCIPDCYQPGAKMRTMGSKTGLFQFSTRIEGRLHAQRSDSADSIHLIFSDSNGNPALSWTIPRHGWQLNLSARSVVQVQLNPGPDFTGAATSGFGQILERSRYVALDGGSVHNTLPTEPDSAVSESHGWFGIRNRFWAVLIKPAETISFANRHDVNADMANITILPGDTSAIELVIYIGPVEPEALATAAPELRTLMYSGLWTPLRWICQGLLYLFHAIHSVIPHWPGSIVVLSLLVGILMRPLSRVAERLQDDVNIKQARLEPHLRAIKMRFSGEQQANEILALYKSEGIHPLYSLKSLVGVMIVLPVFIGAFDMLAENIWLSGESFLWIHDLSLPDSVMALPFNLPFLGNQLNVLPWIMTIFSVGASYLHQPPGHSREMHQSRAIKLLILALAFLVLFYTFPAGMVLYWTSNNLISIIKALHRRRLARPDHTTGPTN